LARRHAAGEPGGHPIDVVSFSLGYYHESPQDAQFDSVMYELLQRLGRLGVAVIASAGNNSTDQQMFPAGFTPNDKGPIFVAEDDCVQVISVGALNPDGSVAMFSNGGPWVRVWERGAAVVSTMPDNFDHSRQAQVATVDPSGLKRNSLDPDNFTSGFALGSGTSYAAPVVAGKIAQRLIDKAAAGSVDMDATGAIAVQRGTLAVDETLQAYDAWLQEQLQQA